MWYVLAAWSESKEWCGVEYGFGTFDASILAFDDHGPCFPVDGLELPTSGWPGPNEGVAMTVVGGDTWTGNWVPVYYFVGYAYSEAGQIPIDVDPQGPFIGFANCQNPPGIFPVAENTPTEFRRGAMGINIEGIRAAPGTPPPMAVCCVDLSCLIRTEVECADLGGVWHPEWESCDPNPCDPEAVCCYGPMHVQCVVVPESQCAALPSGVWHPEWTSCDPNPCTFTPARSTSWGRDQDSVPLRSVGGPGDHGVHGDHGLYGVHCDHDAHASRE